MKTDQRVDDYIDKSPDFARPILDHIRKLVNEALPEAEETIKWNCPNFTYKGEIVCAMASFKKHLALNFWRGKEFSDPDGILLEAGKSNMAGLKKVTGLHDLPADEILKGFLWQAKALIDFGSA